MSREHNQEHRGRFASEYSKDKIEKSGGAKFFAVFCLLLLVFTLSVSLALIHRSGMDPEPLPTTAYEVKPLDYQVNQIPTQPITQGEEEEITIDLREPKGKHNSPILNILLLGVEGEKNDSLILCSIHMSKRSLSFLSIPRDTYIAGNYEIPKISSVYGSVRKERAVSTVIDAVKGMFGFAPDYYFLLDDATVEKAVELAGPIEFHVPDNALYHKLHSGMQKITKDNAFELFRFRDNWTDVETEPTKVQRDFLLKLFSAFLSDKNAIAQRVMTLSEVAQTDLTVEELAYLAYVLADFDFSTAQSRPLPGGENEIAKKLYFQVSPSKAVALINEHHNPLKKDLTIYQVNFRQETKGSGEGEYSDYGHNNKTEPSTGKKPTGSTAGTDDPTEDTTDPSDGTEDSTGGTQDPSDGNTTPTEDTQTPTGGTEPEPTEGGAPDSTEGTQDPPTGSTDPQPTGGATDPTEGTQPPAPTGTESSTQSTEG